MKTDTKYPTFHPVPEMSLYDEVTREEAVGYIGKKVRWYEPELEQTELPKIGILKAVTQIKAITLPFVVQLTENESVTVNASKIFLIEEM